jgi:catechol 2,3-dioxygenase-like lactoylglutathione lyase family enzyme
MDELLTARRGLGLRAPDIDGELRFLSAFGATDVHRSSRMHEGQVVERVHLYLASGRISLFTRATYDERLDALGQPRGGGLSHMSFSVPSTDKVLAALEPIGVGPLYPTFVVAATAKDPARKITYFRSPNGTILETQEAIEGRSTK